MGSAFGRGRERGLPFLALALRRMLAVFAGEKCVDVLLFPELSAYP